MKPTFLIPGAGKSGTSSLRAHLNEHPQIFFCRAKEPNYFAHAYDLGEDWYTDLFRSATSGMAAGEASTHYFWFPDSPARIHRYNPDIKFVFTLRDPVRRSFSDYTAKLSRGGEKRPYRDVATPDSGIVAHSRYFTNISRYLEHFPLDQMHFVMFDDLVSNTGDTVQEICEFLGVDPTYQFTPTLRRDNNSELPISNRLQKLRMRVTADQHDSRPKFLLKGALRKGIDRANHVVHLRKVPMMKDDDRKYMQDLLADEVIGLEGLLGKDLSSWK
jgi:hypothetical protein